MAISKVTGLKDQKESIGSRPEFYLVYLMFYFFPWLFQSPTKSDIVASVVAIAIFIPIYFHGHKQTGTKSLPHIIVTTLIGFAVSPFAGSHGVFHIYALVQTGFVRPERLAWIGIILLSVIFSVFSLLTNQSWWDVAFPIFMGLITSIGSISTATQMEQHQLLRRSRELDQHLAAVTERERIAQDLHDLLGQTLTMVALKSEVAMKLFDSDPKRAKQEIEEIRSSARTALSDVREAVAGMNTTTLEAELKRAKQILSSASIRFTINGVVPILNSKTDQVLGLTVRETVTNIVRHSQARSAILTVEQCNGELLLVVEDDGVGASATAEGAGLSGLRKRIQGLGGSTDFETEPSMKVTMHIPNWSATA